MKLELPLPTHQEVVTLVACPKCQAAIGQQCHNPSWRNSRGRRDGGDHRERIDEARRIIRQRNMEASAK